MKEVSLSTLGGTLGGNGWVSHLDSAAYVVCTAVYTPNLNEKKNNNSASRTKSEEVKLI